MNEKTYNIITFGCQMNERDSETLAGMLEEMGYVHSEDPKTSDVVILNTCSVRDNADKRFYGVLGQLKHGKEADPEKVVALCGCMMQQEIVRNNIKKRYPWVDLIFGTQNIEAFPELFERARIPGHKRVEEIVENGGEIAENLPSAREFPFKAFVNIMDGCNNFCTYCIVPYTRGRERSRRPGDVLAECRALAADGVKEIMLLGQNVNSYGRSRLEGAGYYIGDDASGPDFAALLREVDKIEGIERIRFMSSHPKDVSDDLVKCFAECKNLCRMIHLPVQSGSDDVLRRMNRHYTHDDFLHIVDKLRTACPEIAITTDLIVGFPGETEEDFEETLRLVREVRFDSAFTFIYSPRPGTPAAKMEQVPDAVCHERFDRLMDVLHGIQEEKSRELQDAVLPVLVEGPSKTDASMLTGRTEQGKVVDLPGDPSLVGQIVPVKIVKAQTFSLYGELCGSD